jgi:hypothetical protein
MPASDATDRLVTVVTAVQQHSSYPSTHLMLAPDVL